MSGDVGAEVAAVVSSACVQVGLSPRWCDELAPVLVDALAPLIAVRVEAAKAQVVKAVERDLDDADQITDSLDRPNRIAVWGVRRTLAPFGGKPHRWPVPAEFCAECKHRTSSHGIGSIHDDEERCREDDCDCLLSNDEAAWGRDEAMDESIRSALWEDAVVVRACDWPARRALQSRIATSVRDAANSRANCQPVLSTRS